MSPNISDAASDGFILTEQAADNPISQRKAQAAIREYVAVSTQETRQMATRRYFPRFSLDIMPLIELIAVTAAGFMGAYVMMLIIKAVLS